MAKIEEDGLYQVGDIKAGGSQFQFRKGYEVPDGVEYKRVGDYPSGDEQDQAFAKLAADPPTLKAQPAPENKAEKAAPENKAAPKGDKQ